MFICLIYLLLYLDADTFIFMKFGIMQCLKFYTNSSVYMCSIQVTKECIHGNEVITLPLFHWEKFDAGSVWCKFKDLEQIEGCIPRHQCTCEAQSC